MNYYSKLVLQGFFLWLFAFAVSFVLFPIRQSDPIYFETLMTVTAVLGTIVLCVYSFRREVGRFTRHGILAGFVWMLVNVLFDLVIFVWGPLRMTPMNYFKDIGLTYLSIIIITSGIGYLLDKKITNNVAEHTNF